MACLTCRLQAWLRRKWESIKEEIEANRAYREDENARFEEMRRNSRMEVARRNALRNALRNAQHNTSDRRHSLPPPYARSSPPSRENLDTIHARNPPSPPTGEMPAFIPLTTLPATTLREACENAANAVDDAVTAAIFAGQREMVATRILRTIATVVSTSRSYPVFVAAVTMAESMVLLCADGLISSPCTQRVDGIDPQGFRRRKKNAFDNAIGAAMAAADDAPPDARPGSTKDLDSSHSDADPSEPLVKPDGTPSA